MMKYEALLDFARSADETDPLQGLRSRFALPRSDSGEPLVYLAGHSLGAMPLAAREVIEEELEDWARFGVFGHEHARRPWIPYHQNLAAGLCELTGARPNEVVAMSSLTVNLHLLLASFYRPEGRRTKILIEAGAFSSDRHAVASQIAWHGLDPQAELIELAPAAGEALISESAIEQCLAEQGEHIALVLWPGVQFRTGQAFDIARITRAAHRAGALAGFDLAHSIGNTPLSLHDDDADFAAWCSYKYLNAGPGAIGGLFVHERHVDSRPRLSGWWGHEIASRFAMKPPFRAEGGAAGWAISNPPILATAPLIASLALFQQAGVERLREKSIELTGYAEFLLDRLGADVQLITPRDPEARGCQLSFRIAASGAGGAGPAERTPGPGASSSGTSSASASHARTSSASASSAAALASHRSRRVFELMLENLVACDWREPDIIRVAPVPLYNSFEDVFRFAGILRQALERTR